MKIDELFSKGLNPEYNYQEKIRFKKLSRSALVEVAKLLGTPTHKPFIRYNAGGIAVSGDAVLHAMLNDDIGVYIHISMLFGKLNVFYRTCKGLKDYSGGYNRKFTTGAAMIADIRSWKYPIIN